MIKCEELEKCFSEFSDKKKTLNDKKGGKSKYYIENKLSNEYHIIDFENCVYKDSKDKTKCDFGLRIKDIMIFVELKGSDIKKGIIQLKSTIEDNKHCFKNYTLKARMIITKSTKPDLYRQRKEYIDLMKIVNKDLVIKNSFTEII